MKKEYLSSLQPRLNSIMQVQEWGTPKGSVEEVQHWGWFCSGDILISHCWWPRGGSALCQNSSRASVFMRQFLSCGAADGGAVKWAFPWRVTRSSSPL